MKNHLYKRPLALLMAMAVVISTLLAMPVVAHADTPQSLETTLLNFWADPENAITQNDIDSFTAGTKTTMVGAVSVHKRTSSENGYYLFLPSNANCNSLKVWFTYDSASVTVDGTTTQLTSGQATDVFKDINEGGISKSCTLNLGGTDYSLVVIKSGQVGTVYIDTESGSVSTINASKSNSESGTIMVIDANGNVDYDGPMAKMAGRGNGTWDGASGYGKYPYNVKLGVSTSLLGMNKAKKWCLLANNNETTLIKNQLTYDFSSYIGVKYQPKCKPVDVYVNQQYFGSYQLSEKVEIKSNRINVSNAYDNLELANSYVDETTGLLTAADVANSPAKTVTSSGTTVTNAVGANTVGVRKYSTNLPSGSSGFGSIGGSGKELADPEDISGGYLYELEISQRWVDENAGFCGYNRQGWVMKNCDVATKNMVDYSYDLLYALGSSVYNNGVVPSSATTTKCPSLKFFYSSARTTNNPAPASQYQGKKWSDILDADSAVKYYWTQEYFKNMDSSASSTYFYKDTDSIDSKLYAGPVWDMDNSIGYNRNGSRWGHSWTSYDDWYTKNSRIYRFVTNDSTTTYSSDNEVPLSFYGALATNCSDFWSMAQSYWYGLINPAVQVLLGNAVDETGTLKSTAYYVNNVAKSNTMNNVRFTLNNGEAWDYAAMINELNSWFTNRSTWISSQFSQVDIANATFSSIPDQTCNGSEIKPEFTLTYNGTVLKEGMDYTVEYSNNIASSKNATITVTGCGYYTGTKSTTFIIGSGSLVDGSAQIPILAYSGDELSVTTKNAKGDEISKFIKYQWKADGVDISGATDSTYTVTDSDKGKVITVFVSGDGTNIASMGITSNECAVSAEEKPKGYVKTIASWNYDYTAAPDALATADVTGATYYYTATSGERAESAELTSSVNAVATNKIKWSGTADLYASAATTITPDQAPVMSTSKSNGLAWGEYPYFQTTVSTVGFEDITFSAKLGGTKKAPRSWKLQYSVDGTNYTDVENTTYTIAANKTMVNAFENVALPADCNNKSKIYVRIVACENLAINGINTIIGSTSGDIAINNVAISGASTATVTELAAPTVTTTSVTGSTTIFTSEGVACKDNNGGADLYYSVNGAEPVLYQAAVNPFDENTAIGTKATITVYAQFNNIKSDSVEITVTNGGADINNFVYSDYSQNVSNGAVLSTGGVYEESGKMTAYTNGVSQYVPLYNAENSSYSVSPDDGALWSENSGFYYETTTAGFKNIAFTAQAYTTSMGPKSVSLQYSLNGKDWQTVNENVALAANGALEDLLVTAPLPSECDNQAKLYLRLATTENATNGGTSVLWNKNSKGNLYVNNVVVSGQANGEYKMPYTNKTSNYFGGGAIKYVSPDGAAMQYAVTDSDSKIISSGAYPNGGIIIATMAGFDSSVAGPYTVSVWAEDDEDKSVVNTRAYYYKGDTVTKFKYNSTTALIADYANADYTELTNTAGASAGTLSIYPNGKTAAAMGYTGTYGVKASWSAANPFTATKKLDNPSGNGFWLIKTSTKGYSNLTLNLKQLSSNNGPRDWGLAYSTDGESYTYIDNSNVRAISNDSSKATVETYNNFALPEECNNKEQLYIKVFINGGESVDGTELELVTKGNTGIDSIELSGVAIRQNVDVTFNTVAYESLGTENLISVDGKIIINDNTYETTAGSVTVSLVEGRQYTVYASVNGTFVNKVTVTAQAGEVQIAVVAIDFNGDGIINGKDFAAILRIKDAQTKATYRTAFASLADTRDSEFTY